MKKLFLLDAYALIYRSYYAFIKNPRINSKGLNTSAILGFVNTLEDVLKHENPEYLGVAFDPHGPTFRHEAYPAYKAQREATPEDIRVAVPIIKEILNAYHIPILEVAGFEADDVIGTMAKRAAKEGYEVYMLTPDKDYGQLVEDHIFMYRPRHNGGYEIMGVPEILAKYTLVDAKKNETYSIKDQLQVIDLLGLMGDTADNIPGCPGIGDKTAIKLMDQFGSIEEMLARTNELTGATQKKIVENKEQITFSKFLATIKVDVPIDCPIENLRVEEPDWEKLGHLFTELEFKTLLKKLQAGAMGSDLPFDGSAAGTNTASSQGSAVGAKTAQPADDGMIDLFAGLEETNNAKAASGKALTVKKAAAPVEENLLFESELDSMSTIGHQYSTVMLGGIPALVEKLMAVPEFCFDTETTDVDVFKAELVGMSFSWKAHEAYFIPISSENAAQIIELVRPVFEREDGIKIGQNLKFDILMLSQYGIEVRGELFDTMIAHYVLQPELRHGMDYLAEIYLHYSPMAYEDMIRGEGKKKLPIREVPLDRLSQYAAEDADITWQLYPLLKKELQESGMEKLFYDIEMPLVRTLVHMEQAGVRIDAEALQQSAEIMQGNLIEIEKEVCQMAGKEFNLSSAKQVGEVLFDDLQIDKKARKTKTGQYVTSEEVLEKLRDKHPIVGKILEYRGIKKLLSTYIEALPALVNPKTGKIHSSYNQAVTATGRLSSSNPNLQNIPIRDEQGKEIRKAFIPDEGCLFFSADYSQIELRIMAHMSQDEHMLAAFNADQDIHAATAAKIYHLPIEEVTSDMRRKAKTANFGIIYGISAFGLSERLTISRAEAKELIDGYFASYPHIKDYMDRTIAEARDKGYVETLLGRKRYLPDLNSANSFVRGFAERNAINAPIQGSAADIIKIAMNAIDKQFTERHLRSQMILQVHDELNFNVFPEEAETVKSIVLQEMENAMPLTVKLIADCAFGKNWLEAH